MIDAFGGGVLMRAARILGLIAAAIAVAAFGVYGAVWFGAERVLGLKYETPFLMSPTRLMRR